MASRPSSRGGAGRALMVSPKVHRRVVPQSVPPAPLQPLPSLDVAPSLPLSRPASADASSLYVVTSDRAEDEARPSSDLRLKKSASQQVPSGYTKAPLRKRRVQPGSAHRDKIVSEQRPKLDLQRSSFSKYCMREPFPATHATLINDVMLVGSREAAASRALLFYYGVTHILNASLQVPTYYPNDFVYLHLPILDNETEKISTHFRAAFDFIHDAYRAKSRVLIHCVAGVSRSVTFVVAYLMVRHKMRLLDAMNLVIKKRFLAEPNPGFRLALAELEIELFGTSSVAKTDNKLWHFPEWNRKKRNVLVAPARPKGCSIM